MNIDDIVVPVDFSECSKAAVAQAELLGKQYGATLHLLHAVHPIPYPPEFGYGPEVLEDVEARAALQLLRWSAELRENGCDATEATALGPATDAIHRAVREVGAGLVVMGTHGYTGMQYAFLGSVAARTLRASPCPVWTVRGEAGAVASPLRRVLFPTDFSPSAEHALDVAISLCRDCGAELNVIHVFHSPLPAYAEVPTRGDLEREFREAAEHRLHQTLEKVKGAGLDGAANLREGSCAVEIADCAKNHGADLIVLGTRGNRGVKRAFLGSVAERVVRSAPCSVLTTTLESDEA